MGKDSFIFYRSFAEAIDDLPDNEQLEVYRAIKEYALNENEIDLTGTAKSFFKLIKPQIAANNRKYKNGTMGGRPKKQKPTDNQSVTKQKPSDNLDETKPEPNQEPEKNQKATKRKPNVNENGNVNSNDHENFNDHENENDLSGSAEPPEPANSILSTPDKAKPDKPKKLPLREREPVNDMERVEKAYWTNWDLLFSQKRVKTPDPVVNWGQTRKLLKTHFEKLKPEQIIQAVNNGMKDDWIMKGGYSLGMILSASVLNRLINTAQAESPVSKHQREKLSLE